MPSRIVLFSNGPLERLVIQSSPTGGGDGCAAVIGVTGPISFSGPFSLTALPDTTGSETSEDWNAFTSEEPSIVDLVSEARASLSFF